MIFLKVLSLLLLLCGCSSPSDLKLKVVASAVPHGQILEEVKSELEQQGITLEIILTDDYNMPNMALANGDVDANFFQHKPFLEEQKREFGYKLDVLAPVEIEPMGIYSKKINDVAALPYGAKVAIPNDPTNEARALLLLQENHLIALKAGRSTTITVLDIEKNEKGLKFVEVDAAMLPRTLDDVDVAVINTNYALAVGFSPLKEALALEKPESPYVNVVVIRSGEEKRPELVALKKALNSDKMRTYILLKYEGAVLPAF